MARHINLIEIDEEADRPPYLSLLQIVAPVVLTLLVSGVLAMLASHDFAAAKQSLVDADAQLIPLQDELTAAQTGLGFEQANAELRQRISAAELSLKAAQEIDAALQRGELGDDKGFSSALRAFALHVKPGVWITDMRLERGAQDLAVGGVALNPDAVSVWVRALRSEPLLDDRSVREFRVVPMEAAAADASAPQAANLYRFMIASDGHLLDGGKPVEVPQ